ncbi:hypothetical protein TrLO_g10331 [Triparma laevis f. longispina]|uniref:Complex 1 LYR protein domain-containing protein n=1 Tax=Triparma laevis f. longispina TaxID=1714387 RepID=A0A9W6ZNP2_9STRA|nr:hypothetical protein TrLO_g10331 [Triparma laevis f. longispina]
MSLRPQVLSGFRRLLRARRIPFASDPHALSESRKELKTQFMLQKDVTDNGQIIELLKGIDEVEEMLRTSIVQGTVSGEADKTRVNVKIREDNKDAMDKDQVNQLESLGGDLGGKEKMKPLSEVKIDKSS